MKQIMTFIVLCVLSSSALSDEIAEIMKRNAYFERELPELGSKSWFAANHSFPATYVSLDTSLVFGTRDEKRSNSLFDAGTVKYVGVDRGEFGGGLYLNEYKQDEKPFFSANIKALIPINDDLYIISGTAHMNFSGGAIHVIRNYKVPTTPIQITLLPDAPSAILIKKSWNGSEQIIMAGHSSLMEFTPDSQIQIIAFKAFWRGLYPSSIVEYNKSYYIGIRSGVAVVTPEFNRTTIRYFVTK